MIAVRVGIMGVVIVACGCAPPRTTATPTNTATPTATATATPTTTTTDEWCRREVFGVEQTQVGPTLQERMPSTQMVAIATKALSISDCSSVGWYHLAFVPAPKDKSGLVGAYLKRMLPVVERLPDAPYYLVGSEVVEEHAIDLGNVCVEYRARINAKPQWVVPIADDAELAQWRERVAKGLCGRTPPSSHDS